MDGYTLEKWNKISSVKDLLQLIEDPKAEIMSRILDLGINKVDYFPCVDQDDQPIGAYGIMDFVNSAEDEDYGKPHPAVYLTVANKMNVDTSKCLVIEDSLNGVISGMAAKMKVVCIPEKTHNPEPKLEFADYLFGDMSLLLDHLKTNA